MISPLQIKEEPLEADDLKLPQGENVVDLGKVKSEPLNVKAEKVCQYCGKEFSNDYILRLHLRVHVAGLIFNCEWCTLKFTNEEDLRSHKSLHKEFKFECKRCETYFDNWGDYRSHVWKHGDHRPHKCNLCPKTFDQANALKLHVALHSNPRIKCEQCGKSFSSPGTYDRHVEHMHETVVRLKCELCNMVCLSEKLFVEHSLWHQQIHQSVCKLCKMHFSNMKHYVRHTAVKHVHKCSECELAFVSRYTLQNHLVEHIVTGHQCERCLKLFKTAAYKKVHLKFCKLKIG